MWPSQWGLVVWERCCGHGVSEGERPGRWAWGQGSGHLSPGQLLSHREKARSQGRGRCGNRSRWPKGPSALPVRQEPWEHLGQGGQTRGSHGCRSSSSQCEGTEGGGSSGQRAGLATVVTMEQCPAPAAHLPGGPPQGWVSVPGPGWVSQHTSPEALPTRPHPLALLPVSFRGPC